MNLYEIANEYQELLDAIEANEGDIENPELLEQIETQFKEKGINVCYAYKTFENSITNIDAEIERLNKLKQSVKNKQIRFEMYFTPIFKKFGQFKTTPGGIRQYHMNFDTFKVVLEEKDVTELKNDIFIKGLTTNIVKVNDYIYDRLDARIKEDLVLQKQVCNKTDVISQLNYKQLELAEALNEYGFIGIEEDLRIEHMEELHEDERIMEIRAIQKRINELENALETKTKLKTKIK